MSFLDPRNAFIAACSLIAIVLFALCMHGVIKDFLDERKDRNK